MWRVATGFAIFSALTGSFAFERSADESEAVRSITVYPEGPNNTGMSGWILGFARDGSVSAQFGSTGGDHGTLPNGTVSFQALLKAVQRIRTDMRGTCATQVAIIRKGESSHQSFFITDDTVFRYLMDAYSDQWVGGFGGRFEELLRIRPIFPDS